MTWCSSLSDVLIPQAVRDLLDWWLPRARGVLGASVRSVLLHGSVVLGDFQAGWSDVDVCLVLRGPLSRERRAGLEALQRQTDQSFLVRGAYGWSSGQTVDVIRVHAERGDLDHEHFVDPFDQLGLAAGAHLLAGEGLVVRRPGVAALEARTRRLEQEASAPPPGASAVWYASVPQLLARAVVFWRDGELIGKTEALSRLTEEGGEAAEAFAPALRARRQGSSTAAEQIDALRRAHLKATSFARAVLAQACRRVS